MHVSYSIHLSIPCVDIHALNGWISVIFGSKFTCNTRFLLVWIVSDWHFNGSILLRLCPWNGLERMSAIQPFLSQPFFFSSNRIEIASVIFINCTTKWTWQPRKWLSYCVVMLQNWWSFRLNDISKETNNQWTKFFFTIAKEYEEKNTKISSVCVCVYLCKWKCIYTYTFWRMSHCNGERQR